MRELCELYAKGDLHSHVYKRFGLKDANRAMKVMKEEKVYGFEDPDEKHRRESGGRVWKERVCWMEEMMNIEEWKWREEECGWV